MLDPEQLKIYLDTISPEGTIIPDDPNELMAMAIELGVVANDGVKTFQDVGDYATIQEQLAQQGLELQGDNNKIFNLKKAQQQFKVPMVPPPMRQPSMEQSQIEEVPEPQQYGQVQQQQEYNIDPPFNTGAEFAVWLENVGSNPMTINSVKQSILKDINDDNKLKYIDEALDDYFGPEIDTSSKERIALDIFDQLDSPNWKKSDMSEQGDIMADYTQAIIETNNIIKKIAENHIKNNKKIANKKFNLEKYAQHKTKDEVILYGPSESKIDPFSRQPVSDWAIVERNKGFGFPVDDVWNIDWEAIWRGSVMDKYSRPYRDSKTGEWIGGYIQKRFEVDKNIPEQNNYQLKPGQLRKPYLPQYGSTEARLENMREKNDRGYKPNSEGKPFNWKEASAKETSKKKIIS